MSGASSGSGCPPEDELVRMVEGALGDASLAAIESHVDTCERCAAVIGGLGALDSAALRPRVVGRYQLDRRIGGGGMGEVWAAWDPQLRRDIAVKLVKPERADDGRERERLKREARALARLGHPNVLAVYDVGESGDEVFIATELVVGDTLASRGGANSDWRALVRLYSQAARGLAAAHAAGLVHRDIKPANLLIGMDGRVRVADFGLAVRSSTPSPIAPTELASRAPADVQITQTGYIAGTPAYMAPEQRLGEPADARADQYALCIALVEGISGRRPPLDIGVEAMIVFVAERRTREPDLDRLCNVMARGLSIDRDDRFPDMNALADALDACVAPTAASTEDLQPIAPATPRRRPFAVLALVSVAAIGGVGGVLAVSKLTGRDETARPAVTQVTPDAAIDAALDAASIAVIEIDAALPAVLPLEDGPKTAVRPKQVAASTTSDVQQIVELGLAESRRAFFKRDGKRCLAAVDALPKAGVTAMTGFQIEMQRGQCEMLLGECERGTKRVDTAMDNMGSPPNGEALATMYCPVEGTYEVRFKRLGAQGHNAKGMAQCRALVAPAKKLAGEATVPFEKAAVTSVLRQLARCIGEAGDCAEAEALWSFAKSADASPAPWDVAKCTMPASAAPPPDPRKAIEAFQATLQKAPQALLDRDAKACRAFLSTRAADIPQGMEGSFELYAGFCMMMLGDCKGGSARAQKGFGANAPSAPILEDNYCPIAGTLDQRLHRMQAQLLAFVDKRLAPPHQAWCSYMLGAAKAAAGEAQRADQKALAAKNLQHLAWCVSHAGRCGDAADLVSLSLATDANANPSPKLSAKCP
jgi:hypothetical protein